MANELAMMFEANFNTKYPHMPENIRKAGPHPKKKATYVAFLEPFTREIGKSKIEYPDTYIVVDVERLQDLVLKQKD